ncbi:glucosaminidase domain-containing protein [Streptococcus sciuri]|uniref:Glucosaminidase domain-containing protein n=1 Tax=Streptococcus sciuri TaxID=2973939 RepID=A0ABT2F904_9STRE|nr:glucosaminidase domain-containing protein [Streptococcus sciuri]MCS4488961.1 glucosaminidase domain-containing protein [Streptococcus sciuri]
MTSQTKTAFVKVIAPISQKLAHAYGVRPSIIIAQASFESDFGRTLLARRYNNLFNSQVTPERHAIWLRNTKGQLVCYARYKSYQESISAYLMQLKAGQIGSSKSYEAFVATKNVDTLAEFLQHSGFSRSKDYARKIKAIIKVYRLKAYDK